MCQPHCTITPSVVRSTARQALARALPWKGYGRKVTPLRLLDLLLLVAALGSSLSAIARRFRFGFSHETARQAVDANLPDELGRLTDGLVDALCELPGPALRSRRWVLAIDLHYVPFYGDKHAPGVVGGQKKAGTQRFYAYATAVLLHHRRRYTVGLLPVTAKVKPHEVVGPLLDQAAARGLRVRGVVLDSGFDSGETLLLLQERHLGYVVPLRRKGRGDNRRNAVFALPAGTVTTVDWVTEKSRRPVSTAAAVAYDEHKQRPAVYAFGGWRAGRAVAAARQAELVRQAYRRRFGIETSYRQLNQGKGTTTKKDVGYRLLLVGLALLLRQAWVWLTALLARDRGARPRDWVGELPLARLLGWLAAALRRRYPEDEAIAQRQPLPPPGSDGF
jgi:hypothetical protein